jgi:hypothetical protein
VPAWLAPAQQTTGGIFPSLSGISRKRQNGRFAIVPADRRKGEEAEFIVLKDGRIYFRWTCGGLPGVERSFI